jgi:hypothetical protein
LFGAGPFFTRRFVLFFDMNLLLHQKTIHVYHDLNGTTLETISSTSEFSQSIYPGDGCGNLTAEHISSAQTGCLCRQGYAQNYNGRASLCQKK